MSEPVASGAPPDKRSLLAILLAAVKSRDFALRVMIGAVGTAALGWLGPKWAFAGLVLSQLLADTIKEFVTSRNWGVSKIWFVAGLALLFDQLRHHIPSHRPPVAVPLVSTLAATVVVVGAFTAIDTARSQSLYDHRCRTFFGCRRPATAPSLRLPDGHAVTSSTRLTFRDVRVGGSSKPESLILSSGSQKLRKLRISASPPAFRLENGCRGRLPARSRCSVAIVFQPDRPGHVEGRLTISFVEDPELTLVLEGTALRTLGATLAPPSLSFRRTTVGSTAPAETITLRAGNVPLPIARIATGSKEFTAANDCPHQLTARSTCRIHVDFAPASAGMRTATLTVARRNGGRPLTASLTGTGVPRKVLPPTQATLTPAQADFGSIDTGTRSTPKDFTLSAGSSPFPYQSAATRSKDFRITANTCSGTLNAGSHCTISVVFTPTINGDRTATLTITRTDNGPELSAALDGVGLAPYVVLSPASVDFGQVCTDCGTPSPKRKIVVSNTGNATLTISNITSSDPKHFTVAKGSCGTKLPAGGKCAFPLTFIASPGSWSATITLDANGYGQHKLDVNGTGIIG